MKSGEGEVLIAVGKWFQICGAGEEKARLPKSVFILGTCKKDWVEERSKRLDWQTMCCRCFSGADLCKNNTGFFTTGTNVIQIRNWCIGAQQMLRVHSPGASTFLHEMTSWPPS